MIGCTLDAAALTVRGEEWRALRVALVDRTPTERGVRLRFRREPDVEATLAALVAKERVCCGHLAFQTTVGEDVVTLDIGGAAGMVGAIRQGFGGA